MRTAFALIAAGAFFVSGCKTTESASADEHKVFVKVEKRIMESHDEASDGQINIHIVRDGEEPIHIEGDLNDLAIRKQLEALKSEGLLLDEATLHMGEGAEHESRWSMITDGELEGHVTIDIDATMSEDGKSVFITKNGKTETIPLPEGSDHHSVFIMKHGDADSERIHEKGHRHEKIHKHEKGHKKVIVIKGGSEEDIRKQLKEHGIDVEIELDFDEEEAEK